MKNGAAILWMLAAAGVMMAGIARALPPPLPLDQLLADADLVIVGKLGRLTPVEGKPLATGDIAVTQVLKASAKVREGGAATLKAVTLLTPTPGPQGGPFVGVIIHRDGDEGIWILEKHGDGGKVRCTMRRPLTDLEQVKRILGVQ